MKKIGWLMMGSLIFLLVIGHAQQALSQTKRSEDQPKQVLKITLPTQLSTLNTLQTQDKNTYTIIQHLFEGLYRLDRHQQPVPGLADTVKITNQGRRYTFHIRGNARWSNGTPVLSTDFSYAWQRLVNPRSAAPNAYLLDAVRNSVAVREGKLPVSKLGIQTPNRHQLVVDLTRAQPSFLTLVSIGWLAPQQPQFVKHQGTQYASDNRHLLYTGPFILKDWHQGGSHFKMIRNPHYWDAKVVKLSEIDATTAEATNTGLLEFGTQQTGLTRVTGQFVNQVRHNPSLVQHPDISVEYLDFNQSSHRLLKNGNLRQAIARSIDKKTLATRVLKDGSQPLWGFIPRHTFEQPKSGRDFRSYSGNYQSYDVQKAHQYWQQAQKQIGKKPRITLTTSDDESTKIVSEYLKQQLEQHLTGLRVDLKNVPKNSISAIETAHNYDLLLVGNIAATNNLDDFFSTYLPNAGFDYGQYNDSKYSQLVTQANTTSANNPQKQFSEYRQAESILLDRDAALVPLYQTASTYLLDSHLKDVQYPKYAAYFDLRDAHY